MEKSKVLVVEDEPVVRRALCSFIVEVGFSVVEAGDGDHALELYKRERPDVVLLDIRMPGKDGLETLRELKAFDPAAEVAMVTAIADEEIAKQAMAEGAFDYITKPIDLDYLEFALITKTGAIQGSE